MSRAAAPAAPPSLTAAVERAGRRVRLRGATTVLAAVVLPFGVLVLVLVAAGRLAPALAPITDAILRSAWPGFVVATLGGLLWAVARPLPAAWLAREIDRRLGLADRTSAAVAVRDGRVRTSLGDFVTADARGAIANHPVGLDAAFPVLPARRLLRAAGWVGLALTVVAIALGLLRLFGSVGVDIPWPGTGGEPRAGSPTAPAADGDMPDDAPADTPADADPDPETPPDPRVVPPPPPEPPRPDDPEPQAAGARVELMMSAEEYDADDTILALVSAWATPELERPAGYRLHFVLDGEPLDAERSFALVPGAEKGQHVAQRMRQVGHAFELLQPGEHELVAVLVPERGGAEARSEPARFRIRGDSGGGGGGGGGEAPPPPPEPQAQPEPPPPPESAAGGGAEDETAAEPPESEPPPLPDESERKVVVPLFGAGDEVEKEGPRLVLTPGGGPEQPPKKEPLREALPEARRRAEAAVDRAGVHPEDRDLVRRYFERLLRLAGEKKPDAPR